MTSSTDAHDRPDAVWSSAHLFFTAGAGAERYQGDRVILEIIAPMLQRCEALRLVQRFFFVRHQESGHHVRVRMQLEEPGGALLVQQIVQEAAGLARVPDDHGRAAVARPSEHPLLSHVRWLPYEPEIDRYGGGPATRLAETLFHCSSVAALEAIRLDPDEHASTRVAQALMATTALVHAMAGDRRRAATLARAYSSYGFALAREMAAGAGREYPSEARWRESLAAREPELARALAQPVHDLWNALDTGRGHVPAELGAFHDCLVRLGASLGELARQGALVVQGRHPTEWHDTARRLVPSYLHMHGNRLGLFPAEEALVGHLVGVFLQS